MWQGSRRISPGSYADVQYVAPPVAIARCDPMLRVLS
jgi:hypothetical protein